VGGLQGMTEAQTKLVEENVKLVYEVINRNFPWMQFDEDLISVGRIGLCKAALNFDESKGFTFSTFAFRVILNEIRMYLRKQIKIRDNEYHTPDDPEHENADVFEALGEDEPGFKDCEFSEDLKRAMVDLTEREKQVVLLVGAGKGFAAIGKQLGFSRQRAERLFKVAGRKIEKRLQGYD
jgi:RNA polymerase sigma factor (sigma-70 family)